MSVPLDPPVLYIALCQPAFPWCSFHTSLDFKGFPHIPLLLLSSFLRSSTYTFLLTKPKGWSWQPGLVRWKATCGQHTGTKKGKSLFCAGIKGSVWRTLFPFAVVQKFGSLGAKKIAFSTQKAVVGLVLLSPQRNWGPGTR